MCQVRPGVLPLSQDSDQMPGFFFVCLAGLTEFSFFSCEHVTESFLDSRNRRLAFAHHPAVVARLPNGELKLHGWLYEIGTGQVDIIDEAIRESVPIAVVAARPRQPHRKTASA